MKIKFLKLFRIYNPIGDDVTIAEGAIENMEKEDYAQWLIDNGFAEKVEENRQLFGDVSLGKNASTVNVLFQRSQVDDGTAQKFVDYLNAVNTVIQDKGIMTAEGKSKFSWGVTMGGDGELDLSVSPPLAGSLYFERMDDAKASIKKHPNEWKTILEYRWGKVDERQKDNSNIVWEDKKEGSYECNKVYKAIKNYEWNDEALVRPVMITKGQEIWQGATTFSLCVANERGDGCLPDKQWVSTYMVSSSVQEKLEALVGMGIVILVGEKNDHV